MHKLILLALLGASFNAQAIGNMADITIIDRIQNRTLPIYKHHGRYYVAGKPGNTYQIHVQNQQSDSILRNSRDACRAVSLSFGSKIRAQVSVCTTKQRVFQ